MSTRETRITDWMTELFICTINFAIKWSKHFVDLSRHRVSSVLSFSASFNFVCRGISCGSPKKPYYIKHGPLRATALRCNRCSTFEKCSVLCFALERFAGKPDWRAVEKERIHSVPLIVPQRLLFLFFSFIFHQLSQPFKYPSSLDYKIRAFPAILASSRTCRKCAAAKKWDAKF